LPKYLLKLDDDQTILEKSIQEFNFPADVQLYLVINKEHQDYVGELESIISKSGYEYEIIVTDDTRGQAETGYIGCSAIKNNHPVFFFNGDTILKQRDIENMARDLKAYAGAIDVFIEDRDHFSFVTLNEEQLVGRIAEKEAISRYATTGLYGFSNASIYRDYYGRIETGREMYISDIYKLMLEHGEKIKAYVNQEEQDTVILGTPEEYFSNKNKV